MPETTLTPGQINELDKKLHLAGITDHKAIQGLLNSKERFAQFVALLEEKEESVPTSLMSQNSFLERLTQKTQAGKIEWKDLGEHRVEYIAGFCSFWDITFSATVDGFQILLIRNYGHVFMNIRNHESFRLEIKNGENSAVLKDAGGLFTRKKIMNLYKLDSQQKKMNNEGQASELSQRLLDTNF